jgi:hypothetical protein
MADPNPCSSEQVAAVQCIAMDTTGLCGTCPDMNLQTFATAFPTSVQSSFASTQAYAVPGTPEYCTISEGKICSDYESKYSCCCQDTVSVWQNCLVEKDLSAKKNIQPACTISCGSSGVGTNDKSGDDGGSSMGIIIGIVIALLVIVGGAGGFFFYRRRPRGKENDAKAKGSDDGDDESMDEKKKMGGEGWGLFLNRLRRVNGNGGKDDEKEKGYDDDDDESVDDKKKKKTKKGKDKGKDKDKDKGKGKGKDKKIPNSKNSKNKKNKNDLGGSSFHSKTVSDVEEGYSTKSISNNNEEEEQDDGQFSSDQVPSKSYQMKLRNNDYDDNYYDDDAANNGNNNKSSRTSSSVRDRKHDIEAWNKSRKEGGGSFRSSPNNSGAFKSDLSSLGYDDLESPYSAKKERGMDPQQQQMRSNNKMKSQSQQQLLSSTTKLKLPKKISSRELKTIMRDREESSRKLIIMEDEMIEVNVKLNEKDRLTEELRRTKFEQERRIDELELQNERLKSQLLEGGSGGGRKSGGGLGGSGSSHGPYSSNSNRRYPNRSRSRSKSSTRGIKMNGEQGDVDTDFNDYDDDAGGTVSSISSISEHKNNRRSLIKVKSRRSMSRERMSQDIEQQASFDKTSSNRPASRSKSRDPVVTRSATSTASSSRRNLTNARSSNNIQSKMERSSSHSNRASSRSSQRNNEEEY